MRIAHLILAHTAPAQLERLIMRLEHPDADIYIHIDGKTGMDGFKKLTAHPNIFFIQHRVKVYWGSYNIVKATLNGFKQIINSGKEYGYLNLLSGQDYPLKPAGHIHQFLTNQPVTAFMNYKLFEPDWLEALPRIELYHLNNYQLRGKFEIQKLVNQLLPKRKLPYGLVPVGRSQWFTIPMDCAKYIIDYWDSHARLRRFIRLTWAPDEFIFQTILYNSTYRNIMQNNDLRYIDWSAGGASPKTLTMDDASKLLNSGKLFARKFDMTKDAAIMDIIDKHT